MYPSSLSSSSPSLTSYLLRSNAPVPSSRGSGTRLVRCSGILSPIGSTPQLKHRIDSLAAYQRSVVHCNAFGSMNPPQNSDDENFPCARNEGGVVAVVHHRDSARLCSIGIKALAGSRTTFIAVHEMGRTRQAVSENYLSCDCSSSIGFIQDVPDPGTVFIRGNVAVALHGFITGATIPELLSSYNVPHFLDTLPARAGAFVMLWMIDGKITAARGACGHRTAYIGEFHDGSHAVCMASELKALHAMGAIPVREVQPGELVQFLKGSSYRAILSKFPKGTEGHLRERFHRDTIQ